MIISIFKLSDYAAYLDGDQSATERFQHIEDLSRDQFDFLVELIESTENYDWR